MKIHEYQAKELFAAYGIPVCDQKMFSSPEETESAVRDFGRESAVIKAQVHAGGRGKAGGVKIAHGIEEIIRTAREMFAKRLVTAQSGPEGILVRKVLLTEVIGIQKEYYLSMTVDNENECLVIIASEAGGTEIENLAKEAPEKIIRIPVSLQTGYQSYHKKKTNRLIHLPAELFPSFNNLLAVIY